MKVIRIDGKDYIKHWGKLYFIDFTTGREVKFRKLKKGSK